jgi:hypothetical protein
MWLKPFRNLVISAHALAQGPLGPRWGLSDVAVRSRSFDHEPERP